MFTIQLDVTPRRTEDGVVVAWRVAMPKGWLGSIVREAYGPEGFFEVALLNADGVLVSTPFTPDQVERWLSLDDVDVLLTRVYAWLIR